MRHLLDGDLEEGVLVHDEFPLGSIGDDPIELVVHKLLIEFFGDIIGTLQLFSVFIVEDLHGQESLEHGKLQVITLVDVLHRVHHEERSLEDWSEMEVCLHLCLQSFGRGCPRPSPSRNLSPLRIIAPPATSWSH
jgi:hypothetical protein